MNPFEGAIVIERWDQVGRPMSDYLVVETMGTDTRVIDVKTGRSFVLGPEYGVLLENDPLAMNGTCTWRVVR